MSPNIFEDRPRLQAVQARDPETVEAVDACPHCRRKLDPVHDFEISGERLRFFACPQHGDVVPRRA